LDRGFERMRWLLYGVIALLTLAVLFAIVLLLWVE
jgi:hypothetical protein